jgi:signal transduction histidine kinase
MGTAMGDSQTMDERLERYKKLLGVGQVVTSEMNLEALFAIVIQQTSSIMDTEASSIFLHDKGSNELWTLVSTDLGKNEIRIPATQGVAGWVFQKRQSTIVNDTSRDPRFNTGVDARTGFKTRNIICVPLINRLGECLGTLQALNKRSGLFTGDDGEILTSLSDYATIAIENSRLYEELKAMNKAKERAISHLSHELRTPLSLLSASLGAISSKAEKAGIQGLTGSVAIGQRNVQRLLRLQEEIEAIVKQKLVKDQTRISNLIEDALHLVENEKGNLSGEHEMVIEALSRRLESIYKVDEERVDRVEAAEFLRTLCDDAKSAMGRREVEITEDFEKGPSFTTCVTALAKVCSGILRNAIENTPDEGKIEATAEKTKGGLAIHFRDFGIGITEENQKLIFTGFFHTEDTEFYSTKTPYAFGAGGCGADLLRAKVFSERYGFSIDFKSTRCPYVPGDKDQCPGRISQCSFIQDASDCLASGTVFTVTIPLKQAQKPS